MNWDRDVGYDPEQAPRQRHLANYLTDPVRTLCDRPFVPLSSGQGTAFSQCEECLRLEDSLSR